MPYVTATDLLNQFSAEEIAQRCDRGIPRLVTAEILVKAAAGDDLSAYTADEQAAAAAALALIEGKLLDAESVVNGFLTSRYSLPLATVPRLVIANICDIARYQMYDDMATETIKHRYDDAMKMLKCISRGEINLGVDDDGNKPTTKDVATVESTTPVFRRADSEGFI